MKIYFLGTNGWYDTPTGNTICTLIEADECYIILDAGNGIYKVDRYIKGRKPVYLFISHFHLDHIIGLHILAKFNFKQGLRIYGQRGTGRILNQFMDKIFTAPFKKLRFPVSVHELSEGTHHIPFYVKCRFLKHASRCLGYRIKLENKIISYCTDTGVCKNAVELAQEADLFISECSYKAGQDSTGWPHLTPVTAAEIAKQAGAKRLALTHFDAEVYLSLKERARAQSQARKVFRNTLAAVDGKRVEV